MQTIKELIWQENKSVTWSLSWFSVTLLLFKTVIINVGYAYMISQGFKYYFEKGQKSSPIRRLISLHSKPNENW